VERHVRLLAILASLWGALATLVGLSLLLLAIGALAILLSPEGESVALAAGLTAAVFASIGAFTLLWGLVHIWVAARLRRRDALGRAVMLGLAVVNLLVFPFGTALGGYALWILLANEGRRLFEPAVARRS
jgi:membrane associated rhomboid family serine protease